jgi:3-oxoacyl-[acyl-carrier-protein] synthase-3
MAKGCFKKIAFRGIACAVPNEKKAANYWYNIFGQEAVDKFVKMTGVERVCQSIEEQTASDLAFIAAQALLKHKNIDPKSIGALIFISQSPDYRMPSTSCVLQYRLDLPKDCICFDVNLGCSGYVNGINIVASLMNTSNINRALLLVGDTSSKGISSEDKSSAMLFGDAGAATLLEKDVNSENEIMFHLRTDGSRFKTIIKPAGAYRNRNASRERVVWNVDGNVRSDYETYMNGTDVFTFTISEVPKLIKEVMTNENTIVDDYDCFVMHQANLYILKQIAKKIKIPNTKMPVSMDRFGNTSVTSIPLTLADKYGGEVQKIKALMCEFGVGLSWGVVSTEINTSDILPVIHTNDYFKEGGVSHD